MIINNNENYHKRASLLGIDKNSDEEIWTLSGKKIEKITKSNKLFYRCNRVLQRANPQCLTCCVIVLPANKTTAEIHRICAHDYNSRNYRVSLECRLNIKEMFDITK